MRPRCFCGGKRVLGPEEVRGDMRPLEGEIANVYLRSSRRPGLHNRRLRSALVVVAARQECRPGAWGRVSPLWDTTIRGQAAGRQCRRHPAVPTWLPWLRAFRQWIRPTRNSPEGATRRRVRATAGVTPELVAETLELRTAADQDHQNVLPVVRVLMFLVRLAKTHAVFLETASSHFLHGSAQIIRGEGPVPLPYVYAPVGT